MTHRFLVYAGIGVLALLSACSDEGTITTLDANPEVSIPLPSVLFNSGVYTEGSSARNSLRPIVSLDNGDVLSTNLDGTDRWSGTIAVETGVVYKVTVRWVEDFLGADLPLAELTQDLAVGDDGSAALVQSDETSYDTSFDFNSDGQSNLAEREAGTNPYGDEVSVSAQAIADVIVPRVSTADAPLIDGRAAGNNSRGLLSGEWASAVQTDMSGAELIISQLPQYLSTEGTEASAVRRWAAVHDGRFLYVLVLTDNSAEAQRKITSAADNLELLLNADTFSAVESAEGVSIMADGSSQPHAGPTLYELKVDLQSVGISTDEPVAMDLLFSTLDDELNSKPTWSWKHPAQISVEGQNTQAAKRPLGTVVLE